MTAKSSPPTGLSSLLSMASVASWEQTAGRKREALLASIPPAWRVPAHLLPPESQDSVVDWPETSGWLTADELAVTGLPASELVAKLASGGLKSEAVTAAFCKRAAAAHQLVSEAGFGRGVRSLLTTIHRQTASRRPASIAPWPRPGPAMSTSAAPASPSAPCTGSPSRSRTASSCAASTPPSASPHTLATPPSPTRPSPSCSRAPGPSCT